VHFSLKIWHLVAPILLIFFRIKLTRVYACHFLTIEHEQVLRTDDLNNSEIRYTKNMYYPDRGCVHTLLTLYVYATAYNCYNADRSLSSLRLLKTYLHSTMTERRLNGLALMTIHKDVRFWSPMMSSDPQYTHWSIIVACTLNSVGLIAALRRTLLNELVDFCHFNYFVQYRMQNGYFFEWYTKLLKATEGLCWSWRWTLRTFTVTIELWHLIIS